MRGYNVIISIFLLLCIFPSFKNSYASEERASGEYIPIPKEIPPTSTISGVVQDEKGNPVSNAKVLAVHGWESDAKRLTTKTDKEGRFVFKNLDEGYWFFSVNDNRFAKEWELERSLNIPVPAEDLPVEIRLMPPRTFWSQVIDEKGNPVAEVKVTLAREVLEGSTRPVQGQLKYDLQVTKTDAEGKFQLTRLRPGKIVILLDHPDFARTLTELIPVEKSGQKFTINKGLILKGKATYDGKPVANVPIEAIVTAISHRSMGHWNVITNDSGEFEIDRITDLSFFEGTESRTIYVYATGEKWSSARYRVFRTEEKTFQFVEIQLREKEKAKEEYPDTIEVGRPVQPNLKDAQGNPIGFGELKVKLSELPPESWFKQFPSFFLVSIDERTPELNVSKFEIINKDGTYFFKELPSGTYRISTWSSSPFFYCDEIKLNAGESKEVVLEKGPARIYGVINWGKETPKVKYLSWFLNEKKFGLFQGGVVIQDNGAYEINGLPYGSYKLTYSGGNSMHNVFYVDIKDSEKHFDINLPQRIIQGKLIGIAPKPPREEHSGKIFIRPRGIPPMRGNDGVSVDTDSEGKFQVTHLLPGRYTITGYNCRAEVILKEEDSSVNVELKPPQKVGQIAGKMIGNIKVEQDEFDHIYITAFLKNDSGYGFDVWNQQTYLNKKKMFYRLRNVPIGTYGILVSESRQLKIPIIWIPGIEVREGLERKLDIKIPDSGEVEVNVEKGVYSDIKWWRLKMPTGDWFDYTAFNRSVLGDSFMLPFGEYEIEAEFEKTGSISQKFIVKKSPTPIKIILSPNLKPSI